MTSLPPKVLALLVEIPAIKIQIASHDHRLSALMIQLETLNRTPFQISAGAFVRKADALRKENDVLMVRKLNAYEPFLDILGGCEKAGIDPDPFPGGEEVTALFNQEGQTMSDIRTAIETLDSHVQAAKQRREASNAVQKRM